MEGQKQALLAEAGGTAWSTLKGNSRLNSSLHYTDLMAGAKHKNARGVDVF
jgi:hypothetical protein